MLTRECKQCGKQFILSDSEIKFYKSKNLSFPKRCRECREFNKKNAHTVTAGIEEKADKTVNSAELRSEIPETDKKKNNKNRIAVILIFALCIAAVCLVLYFRQH